MRLAGGRHRHAALITWADAVEKQLQSIEEELTKDIEMDVCTVPHKTLHMFSTSDFLTL